jgi:hypothetical protein
MLARTLVAESVHLDGAQCAAKRSSSCAAVIEGRDVGIVARTSLLQGANRVGGSLGTDCGRGQADGAGQKGRTCGSLRGRAGTYV